MLTVRCSRCKRKLFRYEKVGEGRLLRCHKARITRVFEGVFTNTELRCPCGARIGADKGPWFKVLPGSVTVAGTKSARAA